MIEPIQGEAGVIPATPEFMQQLRELTQAHQRAGLESITLDGRPPAPSKGIPL
ncbi:16648_t:CDS:1, partial [Cetraspora pellucida]